MTFIERILKSGILTKSDIELYFNVVVIAQKTIDRCFRIVEMQNKFIRQNFYLLNSLLMNLEQINQRTDLKRLLECIDGSIERMSEDLVDIKDDLENKLLNSTSKPQLMSLSIKKNENFTLDVSRTIYRTS